MEDLDCEVCLEKYDEGDRLPRCLTCGHSVCTTCICQLLLQSCSLRCPFCRAKHLTPVATSLDVPVNYTILKVMQGANRGLQDKPKEWLSYLKQDLVRNTDSLFLEFEKNLKKLRDFQKRLQAKEEFHAQLKAKIPEYMEYLKEIGTELSELSAMTMKAIEKGNLRCNRLKKYKKYLEASKTLNEMFFAHKSISRCQSSVTKWKREVQELQNRNILQKACAVTLDAVFTGSATRKQFSAKAGVVAAGLIFLIVGLVCCLLMKYLKI